MILWTPMQLELVFEGIDDMVDPGYSHITHCGIPMLAQRTAQGGYRVAQLLSTDPMDYLKREYEPGNLLK